jgi:hypothetical protein
VSNTALRALKAARLATVERIEALRESIESIEDELQTARGELAGAEETLKDFNAFLEEKGLTL